MTAAVARAHVYVRGRVQGVNFRARTRDQARAAGVTGWVRNLDDGRVEVVLEGDRAAVERVIRWCHTGPGLARVEQVEVSWEPPAGDRSGFDVHW